MAKLHFVEKQGMGRTPNIGRYLVWEYEDGTFRDAKENKNKFSYPVKFIAAGKEYSSWKELCAEKIKTHGDGSICRDIYGREIFMRLREFPQPYSFDYWDWLGDERYYRSFYIWQEDRLCYVFYEDRQSSILVYEDAEYMYNTDIEKMYTLNWL